MLSRRTRIRMPAPRRIRTSSRTPRSTTLLQHGRARHGTRMSLWGRLIEDGVTGDSVAPPGAPHLPASFAPDPSVCRSSRSGDDCARIAPRVWVSPLVWMRGYMWDPGWTWRTVCVGATFPCPTSTAPTVPVPATVRTRMRGRAATPPAPGALGCTFACGQVVSTSAKATRRPPVASFCRSANQAPASAVVTAALAVS